MYNRIILVYIVLFALAHATEHFSDLEADISHKRIFEEIKTCEFLTKKQESSNQDNLNSHDSRKEEYSDAEKEKGIIITLEGDKFDSTSYHLPRISIRKHITEFNTKLCHFSNEEIKELLCFSPLLLSLKLESNRRISYLPKMPKENQLKLLNITGCCRLDNKGIKDFLPTLYHLQVFYLGDNNDGLTKLPAMPIGNQLIEVQVLNGCGFLTGEGLQEFLLSVSYLQTLIFNTGSGRYITSLPAMPRGNQLINLNVSGCDLTNEAIQNFLLSVPQLKNLNISYNENITTLPALHSENELLSLYAEECNLTNEGIKNFLLSVFKLNILNINGNKYINFLPVMPEGNQLVLLYAERSDLIKKNIENFLRSVSKLSVLKLKRYEKLNLTPSEERELFSEEQKAQHFEKFLSQGNLPNNQAERVREDLMKTYKIIRNIKQRDAYRAMYNEQFCHFTSAIMAFGIAGLLSHYHNDIIGYSCGETASTCRWLISLITENPIGNIFCFYYIIQYMRGQKSLI